MLFRGGGLHYIGSTFTYSNEFTYGSDSFMGGDLLYVR
jgi:hypothetical protein